jgi:riboflavin biosynthesis pyrimidine reductase
VPPDFAVVRDRADESLDLAHGQPRINADRVESSDSPGASLEPALEVLLERSRGALLPLPRGLVERYGDSFAMSEQTLYANFVSSLDGVVALQTEGDSGPIISQHSAADRFVMGILRACADAVIVGAGTFRNALGHLWHADTIYPPGAQMFAEARRGLGLPLHPRLVLVTRSGEIDVEQPAAADALIVTSADGARKLLARRKHLDCLVLPDAMPMAELVKQLHAQGARRLLTEGGPSLFAQFIADGLVDELFLTSAPTLFGRFAGDQRKSLTDGIDLAGAAFELVSLRVHGSHLFLRYALPRRG